MRTNVARAAVSNILIYMHSLQSNSGWQRLPVRRPIKNIILDGCVKKQFQEGKKRPVVANFICEGDGPVERPVKHPRESHAESVHILMPGDINGDGRLFGGQLMQWIDIVARWWRGGILAAT